MRRFLTLVCLLCLAIPAGISISGCTRNPDASYCNGLGYGMKITDVATLTLQPATTGISLAYGQTRQVSSPTALTCKGTAASVTTFTYGTTNNQLVDISTAGNICAGTWNRNSGGGIADYTICNPPNPLPSTGGLPYGIAYVTASAQSVTSNPVEVFVHAMVTSVSLVTTPSSSSSSSAQQCFSQGAQATLDAQACYANSSNQQVLLCAPASITSANSACNMPGVTPDVIASGIFKAPPAFSGSLTAAEYMSGGSITGSAGQTCVLSSFNGLSGGSATVALTGTNTIARGTQLSISAAGSGATLPPTTATLSNGTATCSGTATVATGPILGTAGQTCNLGLFNNGSTGATATVALTGTNSIVTGTPLAITTGGISATAPPTTAVLSNGSAICSGTAAVTTTLTQVPSCTPSIGVLNYSVGNPQIASVTTNTSTNQATITALQPGTTAITASVAGSGSSAGYFSTCPPASISVTLANGNTAGTITQGVTQNLTTTTIDTQGNTITGLSLTYQSTDPIDISAANAGSITTSYPGVASVYAMCEPPTCNSTPINETGIYGTGLPVSSNPVTVTTPGTASDYVWFAAPGQSEYVASVELLTGTVGSTIRLPYVPNSMVMDRMGNNLYFGSLHELMAVSTASNTITTQSPSLPGVVLAVSPNNSLLLVNDQVRQIFYLYNVSSGSATIYGGMGTAAAFTPDSDTLYVVDSAAENNTPANVAAGITGHTDTLYVYNQGTGWITYALPCSVYNAITCANPSSGAQSVAVTIPSVGAFFSGSPTLAHTWCPSGTVGNYANMSFYPQGPSPDNSVAALTDVLAATTDGKHILGASTSGSSITLSDIGVTIPALNCLPADMTTNPLTVGDTLSPLVLQTTLSQTAPLSATVAAINQVVPSPASNLAFITYAPPTTGAATGAKLPFYVPAAGSTPYTVGYVTFKGSSAASITAPLAGAFTPDNTLFFVSTAGDNMIHYISVPLVTSSPANADTQQISPNLPACTSVANGGTDAGCAYSGPNPGTAFVPATVIVVKPRSTT
ncbi:MAG: hypothetical protein ABSC77_12735 [Terracidiphilus sp.]